MEETHAEMTTISVDPKQTAKPETREKPHISLVLGAPDISTRLVTQQKANVL